MGLQDLLSDFFLEAATGLEPGDCGGFQFAGDLGLGVGKVFGLAFPHFKPAKARDGDLVAAFKHITNGAENAVHDLFHFAAGHAGVACNLGNQMRSRHNSF